MKKIGFNCSQQKFRSGSALLMVTTIAALLLLVAIAAAVNSTSNISLTNDERTKTKLEYACESGLKRAKAKIEESFNNGNLSNLEPTILFQGTTSDDTGKTPSEKAYNDETFVSGTGADYYKFNYSSTNDNTNITVKYAITEVNNWHKSQSYTSNDLNIEAIAYSPDYGWVGMSQNVTTRRTTLFMYQVFFQDDLEILPGPNFNLTGLIHTNSNMYLNANSGSSLKIYTDSLTSAGQIYRGRLDRNEITGTVQVSKADQDGNLVTMASGNDASNSNWTSIASNNWQGTVRDKNLGATTLAAPKLQSFTPGGYYYNNAGLRIEVLAKNRTTSNTQYKITYNGTTTTYTSSQLNSALKETTMYDRREYGTSRTVRVTTVDIPTLSSAIGFPSNGLVYMTRDDAVADTDGNAYVADSNRNVSGFKLTNGSQLPGATTFVSNLPTYIQGDFNLHTSTDASTDAWQPCAVIADSINLLSNSWQDSKSNTTQTASSTTYNTVFITGNVPTKTGQYSGGLENFPRFLEDWTNKNTNISGGFIQLFRSSYATGLWGTSGVYSPPVRNWGAESRFANLQDLPPAYANLFPSTNLGIAYSGWNQISKDEATLSDED